MNALAPARPSPVAVDPMRSAEKAGLKYVNAGDPGFRRVAAGNGFRYVDARGKPVRSAAALARIRSLAIPTAWTEVWICSRPYGHIQATGRDARGHKQYRYHPRGAWPATTPSIAACSRSDTPFR
jgi:DNA topoisomerase-1